MKPKLFVMCLLLAGLVSPLLARTWTDASGRKFEATLLKVEGNTVFLNVGGRQRTFQKSQLSRADRLFLASGGQSPSGPARPSQAESKPRNRTKTSQIQANISIRIERLRADPQNSRWVYGSPNFAFICDEDLGLPAIRKFAWMFESVWQFCETLPFDVPRLRAQRRVRMKTYLIEDYQTYLRMGGVPGSAGVFIPSQDVVLVPFQSLDLAKGPGLKDANNTIRHEVTHQLMLGQSQRAGWFIEGVAEYVATVPYDQNRLLVDRHLKSVLSYLTARGWNRRQGHNLGKVISFARLESFMEPNYRRFQAQEHSYAYALALFTYFAKMDGQRDGARLSRYVAALQDGRPEPEARKHLLDGRSYEQLEKDFAAGWAKYGLRLSFK